MPPPVVLNIYHIVHVDRLPSIVADDRLWCDADIAQRAPPGTTIGMTGIKERRLDLPLGSYPDLRVGGCVPSYFCPRSVMLYLIYKANHPELAYRGGQGPIVHLEVDLHETVAWADRNGRRWAFTLSNAGSSYFLDRCDLAQLNEIDWDAVQARQWSRVNIPASVKEGKQAEFLVEHSFSWDLVRRVGVRSKDVYEQVRESIRTAGHRPRVEIVQNWYY